MDATISEAATRAAALIRQADALVIGGGAGMGVDSGLPDFRGDSGFWKAYPPYERLGISFIDAANPEHFGIDPAFGWGFYGHRLSLYRATAPHAGFAILLRWIRERGLDSFVYTSNVDGQFQKAGFDPDRIFEVHGSIHHLQCATPCSDEIWVNEQVVNVDESTMRALSLVRCPRCAGIARPNILMFGDFAWLPGRADDQQAGFEAFLESLRDRRMVVVELGAGSAIPSVRLRSERIAGTPGATLVRINPREPQGPPGAICIATGALAALTEIDSAMANG
jgi:NAD-dependent SIR2 family protein deacetylase